MLELCAETGPSAALRADFLDADRQRAVYLSGIEMQIVASERASRTFAEQAFTRAR